VSVEASIERLREGLARHAPRQGGPPGHVARPSAVLVLLRVRPDGLRLVFTLRPDDLSSHPGQISFPGGKRKESDADAVACALREAGEEIGLRPGAVEVLGRLDDLYTPTGFLISPIVGLVRDDSEYQLQAAEVAEVFEVPLAVLRDPAVYRDGGMVRFEGTDYRLHEYLCGGKRIWGVTARMVRDLLALWPD
jgi:8-oxo-dGTP pyrophosphatase MutT (NUDIX family)